MNEVIDSRIVGDGFFVIERVRLSNNPRACRLARVFVVDFAARNRWSGAFDDLELVVSELVANAIMHGSSDCEIVCRFVGSTLHVAVRDHNSARARLVEVPGRHGGYGLRLVSQLSQAWGCQSDPLGGNTVWAEFPSSSSGAC
jgi:anti-sigma regulatory factor (Ser/Thr protein kinase)